ncbi:hypothetical protein [Prochlorococcus sp. MIT 1223]|uniref:hypothetical protein n=1 Tax=Prochlorococcus sp. MIT 1223 TaxID=3096217 RepID=UPI002A75E1E4|nr:hypothetical protein [Prochlorococcus sp. MIT 1223]
MLYLLSFTIKILDLRDLVNLPFKALQSLPTDPLSTKFLSLIPVIAFVALIVTAIWRQAKRFPVRAIQDAQVDSIRNF